MIFDRWRAVVRKVREFIESYRIKSPLQKRILFEKLAGFMLSTNGINILNPDYKLTWHSYINALLGFDCYVSILYTIYYYRNDFMVALRTIAWISSITTVTNTCAILISTCTTYIYLLQNLISYSLFIRMDKVKSLQALLNMTKTKIYKDFDEPAEYTAVCNKSVDRLFTSAAQDIGVIVVSMIVVTGIPMYQQVILHEHAPILPFFLPFTNPDTVFGFYINHVNHLFFGLLGYPAFLGFELVVQLLKNATWAQTTVISYNLDELQSANEKPTVKDVELSRRVREIMAEFCDADNFLVEFSDIYYWKFFFGPLSLVYSVGIGLFLFLVVILILIESILFGLNFI